jgi:hypothetical protein
MPKLKLNSALAGVRGTIDGWVYKHYQNDKRGVVLSRVPDMSRVKPSRAQLAQRERLRAAGAFYRQVLADPKLLRKYRAIAKREGLSLPSVTMRESMRSTA